MIVVYPMIVSSAVGENAIPGIAKMIENYLIAYSIDDVVNNLKLQRRINFKIKGKKLWMKEGLINEITPEDLGYLPGTKTKKTDPDPGVQAAILLMIQLQNDQTQLAKDKQIAGLSKEKEELIRKKYALKQKKIDDLQKKIDKAAKGTLDLSKKQKKFDEELQKAKNKTVSVGRVETKTLTLEPTSIRVETASGATMVGVKVVPMKVKSDAKLSYLILTDLKLSWAKTFFIGAGRKVMRWIYKFARTAETPSGDPRKDIIMDRTGLRGNAFIVLDKHHDIDEGLLNEPKMLQKLFGLSWGNIVIVDDIQRQASFCMKKFKGICNIMPYAMMYQTLGQRDVYEDLEDARKKSGSLFKYRKRVSKIIGEQIVEKKLTDYYFSREGLKNEKDR